MPTGVTESPAARGSRRSQIPIFSGSPNPRFAGAAVVARGGHGRGHDRRHDHHETRSDGRSNHHHRPSPLRPARRDDAPTETMTADRTKTAAAAASMAAQSQRQTDIDGGASAFEYDDYDDDGGADTSSLYDLSSDSGDEDRGKQSYRGHGGVVYGESDATGGSTRPQVGSPLRSRAGGALARLVDQFHQAPSLREDDFSESHHKGSKGEFWWLDGDVSDAATEAGPRVSAPSGSLSPPHPADARPASPASLAVSEETIPRGNGSQGHHTNLTGASEVVAHALQGTALASPSLPALQRRVDALIAQSEGFLKTTRAVTEACRTQVSVENTTRLEYAHNDFFDVPFAPGVARFGVDKSTPHATSSMGHAGSGAGGVGDVRAAGSGGGGGEEEKEDDDILARWRRRRMQSEAVAEVAKARTVTTASHSGVPGHAVSPTAAARAAVLARHRAAFDAAKTDSESGSGDDSSRVGNRLSTLSTRVVVGTSAPSHDASHSETSTERSPTVASFARGTVAPYDEVHTAVQGHIHVQQQQQQQQPFHHQTHGNQAPLQHQRVHAAPSPQRHSSHRLPVYHLHGPHKTRSVGVETETETETETEFSVGEIPRVRSTLHHRVNTTATQTCQLASEGTQTEEDDDDGLRHQQPRPSAKDPIRMSPTEAHHASRTRDQSDGVAITLASKPHSVTSTAPPPTAPLASVSMVPKVSVDAGVQADEGHAASNTPVTFDGRRAVGPLPDEHAGTADASVSAGAARGCSKANAVSTRHRGSCDDTLNTSSTRTVVSPTAARFVDSTTPRAPSRGPSDWSWEQDGVLVALKDRARALQLELQRVEAVLERKNWT